MIKPRLAIVGLLCLAVTAEAQKDLAPLANAFLSSLEATQKQQALFDYVSDERLNWNFVPTSRKGLPFGEMTPAQKSAAMDLLRATLSDQGFRKANGVFELEAILREVEGRGTDDRYRDPGKYYVSIFGQPAPESLWGWRVEGHHISINVSCDKG